VLWKNHGAEKIDLGVLPGDSCSNAYYVNGRGQVVGTSENRVLCLLPTGEHAFLWEDDGPMVDLNSLIPSGSSLDLTFAVSINDRGEIAGFGTPAGCRPDTVEFCGHAYVLIPCDAGHPNIEGCDYSMIDATAQSSSGARPIQENPGVMPAPALMKRTNGFRFHALDPSRERP
jgi:probable HAF family extracellular repeat protein